MKDKGHGKIFFALIVVVILSFQGWVREPIGQFFGKNNLLSQIGISQSTQNKLGAQTDNVTQNLSEAGKNAGLKINGKEVQDKNFPFKVNGQRQFETQSLDILSRAKRAHIQIRAQDLADVPERPDKITVDPSGWHNIKAEKPNGTGEYWVMNRGHLIGFQFCGENSNEQNLISESTYLNEGGYEFDETNPQGMTYYEQGLVEWLHENPNAWLDYEVSAIYKENELVPRQIQLKYVGITDDGKKQIPISLKSDYEVRSGNVTTVILKNEDPNPKVSLDYLTGIVRIK
ncbi:DNA/RNA non-specific endonuclease [Lactococcus lactis]